MRYLLFKKINYFRLVKEYFLYFLIRSNLEKLSKLNELKDYKYLLKSRNIELNKLHYSINIIRSEQKDTFSSYDYGQGYFYQSVPEVNITGYRNTELRVRKLNLKDMLINKTVLDIGSNTGAILFNLKDIIKFGVGIEINHFLVKISNKIKRYLNCKNVSFVENSFENYESFLKFDVILSLANHKTFDGNTKQNLSQYFRKIHSLINTNGKLIFESHPPEIETDQQFKEVLKNIKLFFEIVEKPEIKMKGFLDKNRKYLICSPKNY